MSISSILIAVGAILFGFVLGWLLCELLVWMAKASHWLVAVFALSLILLGAGAHLLRSGV